MKTNTVLISIIVAACSATAVQGVEFIVGTVCSGAATLNNGSIITIGQPFVGRFTALDGSVSISSGLIPFLLCGVGQEATPVTINLALTLADGRFSFSFPGQPGRNYVVQASTNLFSWAPIWTNICTWTGLVFEDAEAGTYSERFYRVRVE